MPLRNLVLDNLWLKLLALALATLVWYGIKSKIDKGIQPPTGAQASISTRLFERHPLSVLIAASATNQFRLDTNLVNILVKGEIGLVESLEPQDIQVFVDLTGAPPVTEATNRVLVQLPPGITLDQVIPAYVRVQRVPTAKALSDK